MRRATAPRCTDAGDRRGRQRGAPGHRPRPHRTAWLVAEYVGPPYERVMGGRWSRTDSTQNYTQRHRSTARPRSSRPLSLTIGGGTGDAASLPGGKVGPLLPTSPPGSSLRGRGVRRRAESVKPGDEAARSGHVRRVAGVVIEEPGLLAPRLEGEEDRHDAGQEQRQRAGHEQAETEAADDDAAVQRVTYEPVDAGLDERGRRPAAAGRASGCGRGPGSRDPPARPRRAAGPRRSAWSGPRAGPPQASPASSPASTSRTSRTTCRTTQPSPRAPRSGRPFIGTWVRDRRASRRGQSTTSGTPMML